MPETRDSDAAVSAARAFHQLHAAFRSDAERLRTTVASWSSAERTAGGRIAATTRWWRKYRGQLVAHHRVEDRVWFPALAARSAEFVARDEEAMADDHRYLDALLARVDVAFDELADPRTPFAPAQRELATAVAAVASLLTDHFAHEERSVVPRIAAELTDAEIVALEKRADREHGMGELTFLVPWFFEHLSPQERSEALAEAGVIMRILYRVTRPGYRRLVVAAGLGG